MPEPRSVAAAPAGAVEHVGADEDFVVRLEARPDTLAERIVQPQPASWSGVPGLVAYAQDLAETMPALHGIHLVVSTEHERPEVVAARIRAARPGWLAPSSA